MTNRTLGPRERGQGLLGVDQARRSRTRGVLNSLPRERM
jgi:hypothetical protein